MTSRDRRPGFTLIEVFVAATLSLMLLGMMFAFLIPTMRASARGAARVEMQQQAVVSLSKMADDLERSAPAGVSMNTNAIYAGSNQQPPVVLAVQRLLDVGPTGNQVWDTNLYVYIWTTPDGTYNTAGTLLRIEEQNLMSSTAPARVSESQLLGFIGDTKSPRETLATGVVQFIILNPGIANIVSMPLTVRLVMGRNAATGARTSGGAGVVHTGGDNTQTLTNSIFPQYEETFDYQRTVAMRNSN